jgi:signal transduction histidine kinase
VIDVEDLFAQLTDAVTEGEEVAVLASFLSSITSNPCVVLLPRRTGWAIETAGRIALEMGHVQLEDHEIEPWLCAATGAQPWSGITVRHGAEPVARAMLLRHAVTDEIVAACAVAAPFLAARRRRAVAAIEATVAQIIHDLNQPIAALGLIIEGMALSKQADPLPIGGARRSLARLRELTGDLLLLASPSRRVADVVPLASLLADLVEEQRQRAAEVEVELVLEVRRAVSLIGARVALLRGISNVLDNALGFAPARSQVRVTLDVTDRVTVEIRDQGPGVEQSLRKRVFDPFFTTRRTGTGLGLAVARRAAQQHDGTVRFVDGPGGIVRFEFPLHRVLDAPADVTSVGASL